mmetsp:Transcript_108239/g.316577  ORF Transcript_108239/g.316577 Transcript_108239/m.316577 type:complete len:714 (-) Transcript_108239:59-2200(-)
MDTLYDTCRQADADQDGVLQKEELGAIIRKSMPDYSEEQVEELLGQADADENGEVRYEELVAWVLHEDWPDEECFALSILLHDRADLNYSGFVSVDEMMGMRQRLCERLGLGEHGEEAERQRLEEQDKRAAGVDILWFAEWAKCLKPLCEEAGADAFKAAVREELATPPPGEPKLVVGPVVGKVTEDSARILVEPDRDVTVTCSLTPEGESDPAATEELSLVKGRPSVFKFSGLAPGTKYVASFDGAEIFTDVCSFRTVPPEGYKFDRGDRPHFAIASCNKVYTSRQLPRGCLGDLWRNLEIRMKEGETVDYMLHLGDNVYNDHEWYLVEKGKKKLEGHSCKWGVALGWLETLEKDDWDSKKEEIEELFRTAYRETWGHPPTRYVLANVPNIMLFDDHDIRDDFGDRPQDFDPESKDRWLAEIAYRVIIEYQKQLYEDVSEEPTPDYHHHAFGDVGMAFVDVRGCKTFHRIEGDPAPFLGKDQWRALEDGAEGEGVFGGCKALLMLMPVPIAYVTETATMVAGKHVVDDLLGQWSATAHLPEVPRFLGLCSQWRGSAEGRQVLVVGGDVHEGGWTDIFMGEGENGIKQLTTSAIANKMTKPHEAIAVALTRSAASFYDGRSLAGDWKLTHFDWTNFRNYALVDCFAGDDGTVIEGKLIASDGGDVKECRTHTTTEPVKTGQMSELMMDVANNAVKMGGSFVKMGKNRFSSLFK